jgi:NAD(P)-dependent dehydrogenase (short-subunit alcohol dehydrogenase family)
MTGGRNGGIMETTMHADRIDLTGQVALVTGGGRGIGRAIASALARAGAAVAVLARSTDQLAEAVGDIERAGGRAVAVPADVTDRAAVEAAIARAEAVLGPLDLLVNNAGVAGPVGPLAESDPDAWWRCVEVNLRGPLVCSRAVLPGMLARRRGRIVNVASGAGTRALPFLSAYVVSKTAVIRLTENLAAEVEGHGVRVFAIQPGTVRTAMAEAVLRSEQARRWVPWFADLFEQGHDVPPERAGELVAFLASGRADGLSGRFLAVEWDVEALTGRAGGDELTLRLVEPPNREDATLPHP